VCSTGILDTGAEESIISLKNAKKHNFTIMENRYPKTIIAFNGDTSISNKVAMIGNIPANIIQYFSFELRSLNPQSAKLKLQKSGWRAKRGLGQKVGTLTEDKKTKTTQTKTSR
jgi:hypothetical protein